MRSLAKRLMEGLAKRNFKNDTREVSRCVLVARNRGQHADLRGSFIVELVVCSSRNGPPDLAAFAPQAAPFEWTASFLGVAIVLTKGICAQARYVVRFERMATFSVQETRRLILPLEAVVEAVLHFDRDSGGKLFHGTIVEATIEATPALSLALTMQPSKSKDLEYRKFNLAAIAAAIIHYCRQSKIPLPRGGQKTLEVVPEGLAFCIHTTSKMTTWHSTWQQPRQTSTSE